ncbi:MAG: DNA polymerase III subunit beta [Armatimonadetes bacterium]|nr:DNA polymerase III subunit beta [Armatimonadota bacterium]MDE2207370.1 DNA polymerase III subunit beta [Armatimonadota bacterium]
MVAATEIGNTLNATLPCRDLYEAVQTVAHAVSDRTTIAILSHILIESEEGALRLIGYDGEALSMSCRVAASVSRQGMLTAPAKTLVGVLSNLTENRDVDISSDVGSTVQIHCERSTTKVLGRSPADFVRPPDLRNDAVCTVPQVLLREMIRQTAFAVSGDETRRTLNGVLMSFDGETLRMVATDTHRLALRTTEVGSGAVVRDAIVPARTIKELGRLLTDAAGDVTITLSGNQVRFDLPGETETQIGSTLIEGQFPNYNRVIPGQYNKRVTMNTSALTQALRRAQVVARENAGRVMMTVGQDTVELSAESAIVGSSLEELEASSDGDEMVLAFNAGYLLEALAVMETDKVHIDLTEPLKPAVVRPATEEPESATDRFLYVLMPMQLV